MSLHRLPSYFEMFDVVDVDDMFVVSALKRFQLEKA